MIDGEGVTTHVISDSEDESTTAVTGRAGDDASVHNTKASMFGEPRPSLLQQRELGKRCWITDFAGEELTLVEKLQVVKKNRQIMELNHISRMIQQVKKDEKYLNAMQSNRTRFEC